MKINKYNMYKDGEQDNYGIYEAFKINDTKGPIKYAFLFDYDNYIIMTHPMDGDDHGVLVRQMASAIMAPHVNFYGSGEKRAVNFISIDGKLTDYEIQGMIELLQEIKQYYIDTKNDVNFAIDVKQLSDIGLSGNYYCKDIDEVISKIKGLVKSKEL